VHGLDDPSQHAKTWKKGAARSAAEESTLTGSQRSIIRLSIEVYLDHLAPAARAEHAKYVAQITQPSIGVDASRHHATVD